MTIYDKNLKTLANYYPQMNELIEKAKINIEPEVELYEEYAYNGEVILKVKKDERVCYLNGKRDTEEAAEIWVETLGELQNNTPVFIMGVGNYNYLKKLVEKTKVRIVIVVYEPSIQIFLKFLEMVDIEEWMKKHLIIFWVKGLDGMDETNMKSILGKLLTYEMLEYFKNLILPNYDLLFLKETIDFIRMCKEIAEAQIVEYNTGTRFNTVTAKNLLENAKYLCDGYKTTQLITVIPRDIPGIVVAAGPSLNKNIRELKKAKGRAFILAVDTAVKPLLKEGIVPDMFALVDPKKPLDLVNMEEVKQIPLLTALSASSEILQFHIGMKFFYNEGYKFAEEIFSKSSAKHGFVSCGGSVATSAFSLLYKIGVKSVILVGQDLAYTDNKSHADGTFRDVIEKSDTSKFITVEGNYEEKVPTRPDFKIYLDWYNMYIKGCKEQVKEFRVINATEGGAKIEGTEIMTLKDAIEQECTKEVNIQECLERLPIMFDEENREWVRKYLKELPRKFRKLILDSRKIKKMYRDLNKICEKKNIDNKKYLSILKKLDKAIKNIEKQDVYQLITVTMTEAEYILREEQFYQEDTIQKEGKEIARKGILYMENVEKMSALFEEVAKNSFENLE